MFYVFIRTHICQRFRRKVIKEKLCNKLILLDNNILAISDLLSGDHCTGRPRIFFIVRFSPLSRWIQPVCLQRWYNLTICRLATSAGLCPADALPEIRVVPCQMQCQATIKMMYPLSMTCIHKLCDFHRVTKLADRIPPVCRETSFYFHAPPYSLTIDLFNVFGLLNINNLFLIWRYCEVDHASDGIRYLAWNRQC